MRLRAFDFIAMMAKESGHTSGHNISFGIYRSLSVSPSVSVESTALVGINIANTNVAII